MPLEQAAIQEAKLHIGEHEVGGPNRGPFVAKVLMFVRCAIGQPWCASFACFCIHAAAKRLGVAVTFPKTPSTSAIAHWAKSSGNLLDGPEDGCVGLLKGNRYGTGYEHTYLVAHVNSDGSMVTIEGNLRDACRWNHRVADGSDFARIV